MEAEPDDDDNFAQSESDRVSAIINEKTAAAQEFHIRPVKDRARKESCRFDLRLYLFTYFPASCSKGLSPYQEEMVSAFQSVILDGGNKARAVRRSGLKSTLARIATAWGLGYGHWIFPLLVGATDAKANEHRTNFLKMLATSPTHREDFPEWEPSLFNYENPKKKLRINGALIEVSNKSDRDTIVVPRLIDPETGLPFDLSESRLVPYSMQTTDVSGLSYVNSAGETVRPDGLLFDDVQTPQSARSDTMTSSRENAIVTTFMGLAKLGERIKSIMVCTVREEDDLTMRFCDRKRHPDWDGKTFPVLIREPDSKEGTVLWTAYGEKLKEGSTPEEGFALATALYLENRAVMDAGGVVAWEQDKDDEYVSCLQWCMTKKMLVPDFFRCELQQQGAKPPGAVTQLEAKELIKRISGIPRGWVPAKASYLTAFVDSGDFLLWWMICAHRPDMSSWIVEWGTWPEQPRGYFDKLNPPHSLQGELPGASWEEAFVNAHNKLDEFLLGREWPIEGGGNRSIDLLLKDWSDGHKQKPRIESQVSASKYKSRIRPSKGIPVKPGGKPIHLYGDPHRDRHSGGCWVERRTDNPVHVQVDTNMAKGITARRLQTVVGAPSAMLLPVTDEQSLSILCDHLTSEKAKEWTVNGVDGVYYEENPSKYNDLWDCCVGNVVAASILGCALPGEVLTVKERRKVVLPPSRRAG